MELFDELLIILYKQLTPTKRPGAAGTERSYSVALKQSDKTRGSRNVLHKCTKMGAQPTRSLICRLSRFLLLLENLPQALAALYYFRWPATTAGSCEPWSRHSHSVQCWGLAWEGRGDVWRRLQ